MNSNNHFTKKAERRAKLEKSAAAANNEDQVNSNLSRNKIDTKRSKKAEKKRKRNEKEGLVNPSIREDTEKNNRKKNNDKFDKSTDAHNVRNSKKRRMATSDHDSVVMDGSEMKKTLNGSSSLDSVPQSVVDEFYKKNEIQISGDLVFKPIMSFKQLNIDENIKGILNKFEKPTPIQASCWPICLSGRDVIGIAETGLV